MSRWVQGTGPAPSCQASGRVPRRICAAFVAYVAKLHPTVVPALTLAAATAAVIVAVLLT